MMSTVVALRSTPGTAGPDAALCLPSLAQEPYNELGQKSQPETNVAVVVIEVEAIGRAAKLGIEGPAAAPNHAAPAC